jgi:hypothetical protein
MAMTIGSFPGTRLGPGYAFQVNGITASGPDDVLYAQLQDASGVPVCTGNTLVDGATSVQLTLARQIFGSYGGQGMAHHEIAPGDAVRVDLLHYDSAGGFIENAVITGFTWDPTSAVWALLISLLTTYGNTTIQEVLRRVTGELPSLP